MTVGTEMELGTGPLDKLRTELSAPVSYALPLGDAQLPLGPLIGTVLRLEFTGTITCCHCGRRSKSSFGQGYCYPCFKRLAQCDGCIVKPETCHFHLGTCREPEWAEGACMVPHIVYLANSSGLKVGITRVTQIPTRWIDQGATQALPVLRVATRRVSGLAEVLFGQSVADKTNWRLMLSGTATEIDLHAEAAKLLETHRAALEDLRLQFGHSSVEALPEAGITCIDYPVQAYPSKPQSLNLDKTPLIEGRLTGIKGQYLIFGNQVLNVRNFTSYHVRVSAVG